MPATAATSTIAATSQQNHAMRSANGLVVRASVTTVDGQRVVGVCIKLCALKLVQPKPREATMAWVRVANYSLGFTVAKKQFSLYYTLQGEATVTQIFLTATQFIAIGDMFRNGGAINYNTDGQYFASEAHAI
jgi:hypothetical protein